MLTGWMIPLFIRFYGERVLNDELFTRVSLREQCYIAPSTYDGRLPRRTCLHCMQMAHKFGPEPSKLNEVYGKENPKGGRLQTGRRSLLECTPGAVWLREKPHAARLLYEP